MYYRVLKQCNYLDIRLNPGMTFAHGDLASEFTKPLLKSGAIELYDETKQSEPEQPKADDEPA